MRMDYVDYLRHKMERLGTERAMIRLSETNTNLCCSFFEETVTCTTFHKVATIQIATTNSTHTMSSTTMIGNKDQSTSKQAKQVRFADKVEIREIERIDHHSLTDEDKGHKTATSTNNATFGRDESHGISTITTSELLSDVLSSCSSSNSHRRSYGGLPRPIQNPLKIPPMLFNTLPVPTETSFNPFGNNCDRRWKEISKTHLQSFSSSALSAPVRAPSMDQIIDCALAVVLEDTPTLNGIPDLKRQHTEGLADRKNHSWGVVSETKRWKEDPQSPPQIPRRKISMDDVNERRKSRPHARRRP